jgi:hypothetical protein
MIIVYELSCSNSCAKVEIILTEQNKFILRIVKAIMNYGL